jgi:hypothetical protein
MLSRFHQEALQRLGLQYVPEAARAAALKERAAALGVAVPASFAEWYAMRDGIDVLRRNTNTDHPVAIERLGEPLEWRWDETHDLVREEGLLVFMVESQAVCIWALRLQGGDDPPVVVARDPDLEWRACAERFSTFIACQVWDHREVFPGGDHRILLAAQASSLEGTDLAFLRSRFSENPTTHGWPGDNQYRFERGDSRLLIWDAEGQSDWWVSATTEANLAGVTRELWRCADLSQSLYSNDPRGQSVLRMLRSE